MKISRLAEAPEDYVDNQYKMNAFHKGGREEVYDEEVVAHLEAFATILGKTPIQRTSFLDVGCRLGIALEEIPKLFPEAQVVVGVDIVPAFVKRALEKDRGDARVADMHDLPFEEESFDWVVCVQTLEHAYDVELAISEILRVAACGAYISVPLEPQNSFTNNISHYSRSESPFRWLELYSAHEKDWTLHWSLSMLGRFDTLLLRREYEDIMCGL